MAAHGTQRPQDEEEARFEAEFPDRLAAVIAQAAPADPIRPFLYQATLSSAVMSSRGTVLWTSNKFEERIDRSVLDAKLGVAVGREMEPAHALVKDRTDRPVFLTYAPAVRARRWSIFDAELSAHLVEPETIAVIALSLSYMTSEIEYAARALGMSNLEARVSAALFAHGSIKRAAIHAGVTYHTARKALAGAMKAAGVSRQTQLIRKLSELATVTAPPREAVENILVDIYGLKQRDAKLVHLLCEGYSRHDAADVVGISPAVAKDRFAVIFRRLNVESATDLPSLVMGAFAAAVITHETPSLVHAEPRERAPLKLIRGAQGRVIAVNDYGSASAQPVLIAHSSLTTRHPFQKLVNGLQNKGFRPVTIDRPGFGLTDDLKELPDRFATGVDDVVTVCEALGLEKIHVITRGGAFHVLALARFAPDLLDRVVVINPDLLQHDCSQRKGHFGLVRQAFDRYPDSIEKVARWTAASLSRKRLETIIRAGIGKAPADLESFSDPQNFNDHLRSTMPFSTGRLSGFIREQRGYALQTEIKGLAAADNWTILLGGSDPIHDVDEIKSYWQSKLPGARLQTIPDAGRFISLSHTDEVIALLNV